MNENLQKIQKKIKLLKEAKAKLQKVCDADLDLDEEQDNVDLQCSIDDITYQINELEFFINKRLAPSYRD